MSSSSQHEDLRQKGLLKYASSHLLTGAGAGLNESVCALRSNMRQRGGFGRVLLDHDRNMLGLEVRTTRGAELVRDLKAISGGERSFVTAAFITALAQCIAAPFYCLDEARPHWL